MEPDGSYPKITVITPSFNQGRYIERTILSVLSQNYPNLEYIIVDGGSTDETHAVLDQYRSSITKVVIEEDDGQTDALIKGFNLATGVILAWLNSDDMYTPGTLFDVANFFVSNPTAHFVFGDATWIDVDDHELTTRREISFNSFVWTHGYNYIAQPSAFLTKSIYELVGGLDPTFNMAMDAALFANFSKHTTLHHLPRVWSRFRQHPSQKTQMFRSEGQREEDRVREIMGATNNPMIRILAKPAARALRVLLKQTQK